MTLINREGKGMLLFMCIYVFVSVEVSFLKKKNNLSLERYIHEPSYNYAINIYITSKNFLPPYSLYVLLLLTRR